MLITTMQFNKNTTIRIYVYVNNINVLKTNIGVRFKSQ